VGTSKVSAPHGMKHGQYALDPFLAVPFMRWAKNINSWWFALAFPILGGLVIFAAAVEGGLGSAADFQFWADLRHVRYAFGNAPANHSVPSFPLVRDFPTWIFVLVVSATCVVAHRQWQLIEECIPPVAQKGALKGIRCYPNLGYRRIHRILLLPRVVQTGLHKLEARERSVDHENAAAGGSGDEKNEIRELEALIVCVNGKIQNHSRRRSAAIAFASLLFTIIVAVLEYRSGVFQILAPSRDNAQWVKQAYVSWWAGGKAHLVGVIVYCLLIVLQIFVILMQNVVGLFCTYVVLSFSAVAELDADWLNRDGSYGWKPIARVYRTVVLTLALHGLAISVAFVWLGYENLFLIFVLVAAWLAVFFLYLILPYLVFKQVGEAAKRRRIEKLERCFPAKTIDELLFVDEAGSEIAKYQRLRDEIKEVHEAKINPLRLRPVDFSVFVLPVVLTAVQVFFSIKYGG